MKKKQKIPMVSKDTLDIIKELKILDLLQKHDIITAIIDLKNKLDV